MTPIVGNSIEIGNLKWSRSYEVEVRAFNERDASNWSLAVSADTEFLVTTAFRTSGNAGYARKNDTITVDITTGDVLAEKPTATIAGRTATVTGSGIRWMATYKVKGSTPNGVARFDLGSIRSVAGASADPVAVSTGIIVDTKRPALSPGQVRTNGNKGYAKVGDTITADFFTYRDEPTMTPRATIAGQIANVQKVDPWEGRRSDAIKWRATYVVQEAAANSIAQFDLAPITDAAGNVSRDPRAVSTGIIVDTVAPTVTQQTFSTNALPGSAVGRGGTITVAFTTSEPLLRRPGATIAGRTAIVRGSGTNWTVTYKVKRGVNVADAAFDLGTIKDRAGNRTNPDAVNTGIAVKTAVVRTLSTSVSPAGGGGVRAVRVGGASGQDSAGFIGQFRNWEFPDGAVVNVTAQANSGYRFGQWSAGVCEGVTDPHEAADGCRITMNSNKSVTATFVEQCTLRVEAGAGGTASGAWTGDCGATRTISASVDNNYRFGGWSGPVVSSGSSTTTVVVNRNMTVTASFVEQCTLTVEAGAGGTASGSWTGDCGTTRTISASADSGYRFGGWSGPVASSSVSAPTVVVSRNMTVRARFVEQCTVAVTAGRGGAVSGGGTVDCGQAVPLTATANSGYCFRDWRPSIGASGLSGCQTTSTQQVQTEKGAPKTYRYRARFYVKPVVVRTLSTAVSPAGGGGVRAVRVGGASGQDGTGFIGQFRNWEFPDGAVVNVTARANPGYRFGQWSAGACEGVIDPHEAADGCRITMNSNKSVTATFVAQCTLTVTAGTGGTASGTWTGDCGATRTISASVDNSYRFGDWSGPVASSGSSTTTVAVSRNMTVTASFVAQCTVAVTAGTGGTVSGGGTVDCGQSVSITATANSGYCFSGWEPFLGIGGQGGCQTTSTWPVSTETGAPKNYAYLANFNPKPRPQCTLTVTASTGGTASGSWTGDCGTTRWISARVDSNYRFGGWSGPVTSAGVSTTTVVVSQSVTVTASFVPQCTVAVTAGTGGTVSGGGTVDCGQSISITATANSGYCFSGWEPFLGIGGQGGCQTTSTWPVSTETGAPKNYAYLANFNPKPRPQCTLTVTAGTGGTASGTWRGDCGTTRTVSASAGGNYRFGGWSGPVTSSGSSTTTVVVNRNMTVTARFIAQCTLTVGAGAGGSASGAWRGDCGTTRTVSANAGGSYRFGGWSGPVASSGSSTTTVVVIRNVAVTARFVAQCSLVARSGQGGTVSGGGTVDCGRTLTATARANSGYCFTQWTPLFGLGGQQSCQTTSTLRRTTTSGQPRTYVYVASFHVKPAPRRYSLQITATTLRGGYGSVSPSPGTYSYVAGTRVTITANPIFRSTITWGGACSGSRTTCVVIMNGQRTVSVTFGPSGGAGKNDPGSASGGDGDSDQSGGGGSGQSGEGDSGQSGSGDGDSG